MNEDMNKALVYHTISSPEEQMLADINISSERFESHLQWLANRRKRVVPLRTFPEARRRENLIAITFDDGFEDNLTVALPLLAKYQLPMTLFVVADFIGKRDFLTSDQLSEIAKHPLITIGSHGFSHSHMSELDDREAKFEFKESKSIIEDVIGEQIELFAYPYGDCDVRIEKLCHEAGYTAAWSVWDGLDTPYSRWRVPLGTFDNTFRLAAKLSPFYFPIKKFVRPPRIKGAYEDRSLQPHGQG